jgi:lipopolysaccharide biosynthesis glycosyltransferase
LDYLFDYSNRGILKDNVIIASGTEPASGGFFMLRPQVGDYEHVLSILKQQKQQNRVMMIQQNNASNAEFDVILGWGHAIQPPDQWQILDKGGTVEGRLWTFHGSNADQGLLYHWVKYVKRHVSIFVYDQLQNWISPPSFSSVGDGRIVAPQRRTTDAMPMNPVIMEWNTSTYNLTNFGCPIHYRFQPKSRPVPYKDFYHFTGKQKPWEQMDIPKDIPSAERAVWAHDFWFHLLRKAIVELNLNMNNTTLLDKRKPVMKPFAVLRDIRRPNNSKGVTLGLASKERSRNTSNSTRSGKPNAYAFLVAGCNPDEPSYQGFLYNVFLAIYTLWRSGSNAEFVVMIQMGAKTNYTELPKEHLKLFSKLSNTVVHFRYLRKPKVDSFYYAMLSKFAVLTLTSYNRVLFMDADILPLCNLDYLFDYSDRGILKDNAVIATATEPSNGGFFMLRPEVGDYEHIMSIVKRQHDQASKNGWHSFDYTLGWGHAIQPPDEWVNLGKENNRGLNWKFHGGFADQGLLYHWVKYVKMHVSIFVYDIIQNWGPPKNEPSAQAGNDTTVNPVMESNISAFDIAGFGCPTRYRFQASTRPPPYKDHYHFTGSKKPWERNSIPEDLENAEKAVWPADLWFHWMRQANVELDLNLNISSILNRQEPVLGRYPLRSDILVTARAYANSTHARN